MHLTRNILASLLISLCCATHERMKATKDCVSNKETIHAFTDQVLTGESLNLKLLKDRVVLIVNVATFCQYTYQYIGLNKLLERYGGVDGSKCGLVILGIPCNQFGHQEPGNNPYEILNGLQYVRPGYGFKPELLLLRKRDVNGQNQDKLYYWLKSKCPNPSPFINDIKDIYYTPVQNDDISWNFEKILIDHKGEPWRRYSSSVEPEDLTQDIKNLMNKCREQTQNYQ